MRKKMKSLFNACEPQPMMQTHQWLSTPMIGSIDVLEATCLERGISASYAFPVPTSWDGFLSWSRCGKRERRARQPNRS